jgi:hypothetical protein
MPFIIKSFHSPGDDLPRRVHFWQTPWVVECHAYPATNHYGEQVTLTSRQIGGWVTWSGAATVYEDEKEAECVSALRRLYGEVVDAARYLQPTN